jgi:hypothetical protein
MATANKLSSIYRYLYQKVSCWNNRRNERDNEACKNIWVTGCDNRKSGSMKRTTHWIGDVTNHAWLHTISHLLVISIVYICICVYITIEGNTDWLLIHIIELLTTKLWLSCYYDYWYPDHRYQYQLYHHICCEFRHYNHINI